MENEPDVTVHAEATRKSIKKLKLASVGVWLFSLCLWGASPQFQPGSTHPMFAAAVLVWLLSLGMLAASYIQKWWHHS